MDLTKLFVDYASKDYNFRDALEIARKNSFGSLWVVGGYLYGALCHKLYSLPKPHGDFDFIAENQSRKLDLPKGWRADSNKYGHPKFVGNGSPIDLMPLKEIHSIKRRRLDPTIENYLTGTPFSIQSIAYNAYSGKLLGKIGIDSILKREIALNDVEEAKDCASRKGLTFDEMLQIAREKARKSSFTPLF